VNAASRERLFGYDHAFDHPVVWAITAGLLVVLVLAALLLVVLSRAGRLKPALRQELWQRYWSWLVLIPLMLAPVLLGAAWTIGAVLVLSLLCYREFARATGLFREKLISLVVVLGIFALAFAQLDNWYNFFVALAPLTICVLAAVAILPDHPQGYIQRVALGTFGFMLFGCALGHLGFLANDSNYRPIVLLILLTVEANDVFAFLVGKTLGRRKLAPNTSPNKTVAGSAGALVLTTAVVTGLGYFVFAGTPAGQLPQLVSLGVIISIAGQVGDLMLSSIKRDLGVKDMGVTIPGHGGLLDRFNSLLLAAPAVFHYLKYLNEVGLDQPRRIFTGG
jgi:phosphatidate cytidylyltransferase